MTRCWGRNHGSAPKWSGGKNMSAEEQYLQPAEFVDSDDAAVIAYAARHCGDAVSARDKAVRLYYAVRDDIRYDPYRDFSDDDTYRASACLAAKRGYCVAKAALLAACARSRGIPARIAFADVRNHLCTPRLRDSMNSDEFIYHGITELYLDGEWVRATPTFNLELCERFGVRPLEFDGRTDALMHPFDSEGRKHMEYLRYHDAHGDVPVEEIKQAFKDAYGWDDAALSGDFAAEARPRDPDGAAAS